MTKRRVKLGRFRIDEIRLTQDGVDVVVLSQEDGLESVIQTFGQIKGLMTLSDAQIDEKEVELVLRVRDDDDD